MLGTAETVRGGRRGARRCSPAGTPIVLDPVMVAESGAVLLDEPPARRSSRELAPARHGDHAERAGGAGARAGRGRATPTTPRSSRGRCTRSGPRAWSSPAATARRRPTCSSTATTLEPRSPASGIPTARRTARAARTRRRSPPTWRSATRRSRPRGRPSSIAARGGPRRPAGASATGAGPGRRLRPDRAASAPDLAGARARAPALCHNRRPMKFLRMRPGHGEQLIAEGDLEVAEDERAPRRGVPPPARRRACGPPCPRRPRPAAARPRWSALRRDPARHRPRHLLPARRRRRGLRRDVTVALCATAIVVLALLWEIALPYIERRLEQRRARREARTARRAAPATTPAASAAPSSAPASCCKSCVNDEEWAMYRDLGFLRVWGGQAGLPADDRARPARRPVRLPGLPAQADRRLPAADRAAAQRVLRRVPGRDAAVRLAAAARLRRRARQVDGAQGRRAAPDRRGQPAPARPPDRSAAGPARPLAPRPWERERLERRARPATTGRGARRRQ